MRGHSVIYGWCLTAGLVGCAAAHNPATDSDDVAGERPQEITLEVDNRNWSDVVIYILHDGRRTRFVTVTASHRFSQKIPQHLMGSDATFRLIAHPIGSEEEYTSPTISVRTGYTVALTLESKIASSSVGVW